MLSLDYQAGIVYELVKAGSPYTVDAFLDLAAVVPHEERADGGIRGTCFAEDAWYFTSLSFSGGEGKLHVVEPQD